MDLRTHRLSGGSSEPTGPGPQIVPPEHISAREGVLLLEALARVKKSGFGRLVVSVSDGRIVEIELVEKVNRTLLKAL